MLVTYRQVDNSDGIQGLDVPSEQTGERCSNKGASQGKGQSGRVVNPSGEVDNLKMFEDRESGDSEVEVAIRTVKIVTYILACKERAL